MFVKGGSYSIAERGEQLAWLLAALQPSNNQGIVHAKPSIHQNGTNGVWEIDVHTEPAAYASDSMGGISALKKLGWLGKDIEPVVTRGFPTARRPSGLQGLEISARVLFSLMPIIELSGGHHRLAGSDGYLDLVQLKEGVCVWHAVGLREDECACRRGLVITLLKDIRKYRHVLNTCHDSEDSESNHGRELTQTPESHSRNPEKVHSPCSDSEKGTLCSRASSAETSLDSDMLSIPSSSEASPRRIRVHDELSPIIDAVAQQLLRDYGYGARPLASTNSPVPDIPPALPSFSPANRQTATTYTQAPGEPTHSYCNIAPRGGWSNTSGNARADQARNRGRKRRYVEDEDDANEGGRNKPPPQPSKPTNCLPANKAFACHYWKLDPDRHRNCGKHESFDCVARIKQHLIRSHYEPDIHCDKCKAVFDDQKTHQSHLQNDRCDFKEWDQRDRLVNRVQQRELRKKSKRGTEEERWFHVWGILFPNQPPPKSPYIDVEISEDFRRFREYASGNGRAVLLTHLRATGFHSGRSLSEHELESYQLEAVGRALDAMMDDFLASRRSMSNSSEQPPDSAAVSSGPRTPVSSFADSGVGSSNQQESAVYDSNPYPATGHLQALAQPSRRPVERAEQARGLLGTHSGEFQAFDINRQTQAFLVSGDSDNVQATLPIFGATDAPTLDNTSASMYSLYENWDQFEQGQSEVDWEWSWHCNLQTLPQPGAVLPDQNQGQGF